MWRGLNPAVLYTACLSPLTCEVSKDTYSTDSMYLRTFLPRSVLTPRLGVRSGRNLLRNQSTPPPNYLDLKWHNYFIVFSVQIRGIEQL
jgi:hypothetical protein